MMKQMDFEQFRQELMNELNKLECEGVMVEDREVVKNNGVALHGTVFRSQEEDVGMVVYYDDWYERYLEGRPISDIARELKEIYMKNERTWEFSADWLADAGYVKDNVVLRLINYDKNKDRLKTMPHIRLLDMALVLGIYVDENGLGELSIQVDDRYMSNTGVTGSELFQRAYENTERLKPATVKDMGQLLIEMADIALEEFEESGNWQMFCRAAGMYVISNRSGIHGAAAMLTPGILRRLAEELKSDLVVFPSSIHECIAYPINEVSELSDLKDIVKEVNRNDVQPQEVLSDRVYLYERKYNRLGLAFPEEGIEPVRLDSLAFLKPCCHGGEDAA